MAEESLDGIRMGIRFAGGASTDFAEAVFNPCSREIVETLQPSRHLGGSGRDGNPSRRGDSVDQRASGYGMAADLLHHHLFYRLGHSRLGCEEVCDAVFDGAVVPAVRKLGGKLSKDCQKGLNLEVRAFFEPDQVLISVTAGCSSEAAGPSRPPARIGFHRPLYSYRTINGQLSTAPTISQAILSPAYLWDQRKD